MLHDFNFFQEIPKWLTTLYVSLMLIGSFFLLLTIVIFLLIWEKHNIHAWTIFAFVCSMFMMFIFLAVSHLTSSSGDYNLSGTNRCKSIGKCFCAESYFNFKLPLKTDILFWKGILAHFFYLFTMCWLVSAIWYGRFVDFHTPLLYPGLFFYSLLSMWIYG